jgi:hypothetical protein
MITHTFTHEELEAMGLPWDASQFIELEEHRWGRRVRCVFPWQDGLWAVDWYRPATEAQEGQDEWFEDPVVAYRVEERQVVRVTWEPIDDA